MTTDTLNAVKKVLKKSKRLSTKTPPNRVMTALTDWIETYPFDPDPEFVPSNATNTIESKIITLFPLIFKENAQIIFCKDLLIAKRYNTTLITDIINLIPLLNESP